VIPREGVERSTAVYYLFVAAFVIPREGVERRGTGHFVSKTNSSSVIPREGVERAS